ncbi:MAG: glycosyltransferase family 4 protein [Gloeobacteraceae cyanobacterium ES-bin-144]|nr:glycosyltransferase family 4 protein [Verrucomicrobiales bacterium]
MNVAYTTHFSAGNVHSWSGSIYYMRKSLVGGGCTLETIDNLKEKGRVSGRVMELAYKSLLGKTFLRYRRPSTLDSYARQVEEALAGRNLDVVFSPSCFPIARMKPGLPTVFWSDASFAGMIDFYPYTTNLCKRTLREGHLTEQNALDRCSLAIFASDWAAQTTLENYKVDPSKIKVVPYGANIDEDRSLEQVENSLLLRPKSRCQLLFIGVEWQRKGGDIVLETAIELNRRGVPTTLHIVGCEPPEETPDFVIRHGFVSKKSPDGRKKLDKLLSESHFLIVPSRAECYGLVFAEASSYGLPSLAAEVGGIPTVVRQDVNGRLFPLSARGTDYADYLVKLMNDPAAYRHLAIGAHAEYENRLNWRVAGNSVVQMMRGI